MAQRLVPIIALVALAAALALPLAAVLWRADGLSALKPGDGAAIRFTLWQAFLSALASCLIAIPVARALVRQRFLGRGLLVSLLGAPFILPVIVAVLGLLAVFGQNGLVSRAMQALGGPVLDIYGLHGVVLAHVFFNLPLAVRMLMQGWLAIPSERFRLAQSLALTPRMRFAVLEWPLIRQVMPGAFSVIFVICLSSFAVALTLGGGPRATTVELAIYQAMRFDFDLGRAVGLSLVQIAMAMCAGWIALRLSRFDGFGAGLDRPVALDGAVRTDFVWIAIVALFLLMPLGMVVLRGLPGLALLGADTWRAAGHSLVVATGSTVLALGWALPLARRGGALWSLPAIAMSPLVLGAGLFLLLRPFVNPFSMALPVTALVNALMALPFALRIVTPEAEALERDYARLRASFGLTAWAWLRQVYLPRMRRPIGFAAGLTAALAMGDLGVIALFADPDRTTLPLQVSRLMGSYQMEAAAGAALLLLMMSLGLFWILDRGGRIGSDR